MTLLDLIVNVMDEKKARDIRVVDFKNTNSLCDAFVICDAPSMRQVQAIAEDVQEAVLKAGYTVKHPVQRNESQWVLIDAGDVVAHVFQTDERAHYDLERLYKEYIR